MIKKTPMTLGEAIREVRMERGLSVRRLATLSGISQPFMSDIEHGRRRPSEDSLTAIAKSLKVAPKSLNDMTLTRESRVALENDPELLAVVKRCVHDRRYRTLILRAGAGKKTGAVNVRNG